MSAVDNVEGRIARLQQSLDAKCTELHALHMRQRYNPSSGVDESIETGHSLAMLEVKVVGARNMLYKAGFLTGNTTYVRAWLEPCDFPQDGEKQCTKKQGVQYSPSWQESLFFPVGHVGSFLVVEVVQEELIGSNSVVGSLELPLTSLQDQRLQEKWHVLSRDNQTTASELRLSCRLNRSRIAVLEVEIELLQNQLRELHNFVERQRQFSPRPLSTSERYVPRNPLMGKEVVLQGSSQRSSSSRFSAVATFAAQPAAAARKREHLEFANTSQPSGDVAMEMPRAKRQRVAAEEPMAPIFSFTSKLANWLLPAKSVESSQVFGAAATSDDDASYPFSQQQHTPNDKRRAKKSGASARSKAQKTPSLFQTVEQWFFTDPENKPPN